MKRLMIAGAVLAVMAAPALAAPAPVTDCDRLAAHPADGQKVAPGVQWDLIDARAAIAACETALARYPTSLRLQFQLGRVLIRAKRRDEGLPYLFAAAEGGYMAAFANIGGTYQFDLGNYSEALKWYRRGAEKGDVNSETHLAEMYMEGEGVKKDAKEAMRLYMRSAKDGYALSEYQIAVIYQRGGPGVPKDLDRAIQWHRRAADHGHARAQNALGHLYETGDGVTKNPGTAVTWYRRSADQGYSVGQLNLGWAYERGFGIEKSFKEAFYWYRLGTAARIEWVREKSWKGVSRTRHRIGATDIAEVDRRIDTWQAVSQEDSARAIQLAAAPATPRPKKQVAPVVDSTYRPSGTVDKGADPGYVPPPVTTNPDPAKVAAKPAANPAPVAKPEAKAPTAAVVAKAADPAPDAADLAAMPAFEPLFGTFVTVTNVNVRDRPSSGGKKIGRLQRGVEVAVLGKVIDKDWMIVNLPGQKRGGFIFADLLEAKPDAPAAKPAAKPAAQPAKPVKVAVAKSGLPDALANVDFGSFHALIIGNNKYKNLPQLETAVADATVIADVLRDSYGFKVKLLTDATRADIVIALDGYRKTLTDKDNILIYYAGHGIMDFATERGYWLPVDASPDTQVSWVSNTTVTDTLKAMNAKHVMLVVDSCYSGTLTRSITNQLVSPEYVRRMVAKRARVVLTSGGLEPVADGGGGNHSVFAKAFINALRNNDGLVDGTELFTQVRRPVMLNAPQTPEYSDIRFAGHDGGDFLFIKR
jgi:TPR repeat protein